MHSPHSKTPAAIITLNVGGTKFQTTKETLAKAGKGNFLENLVLGHAAPKDSEGHIFVDRDPRYSHDSFVISIFDRGSFT
jgi:hypothetical protein